MIFFLLITHCGKDNTRENREGSYYPSQTQEEQELKINLQDSCRLKKFFKKDVALNIFFFVSVYIYYTVTNFMFKKLRINSN